MKRIIIASSEFPPLPGGIGNHSFNLAKQLNNRGYQVTVLSNARGPVKEELAYLSQHLNGVQVHLVNRSGAILTYLRRIIALRKFVRTLQPGDVVWLSGKFWIICARWFNPPAGVKTMAVVHGTEIRSNPLLFARGLKKVNKVVSVSSYTRRKFIEQYPQMADRTVVINNGHDLEGNTGVIKARYKRPLRLITVGNVHPRKGQDAVIRILPELKNKFPGLTYHMIGIPSFQKEFSQLAQSLGVEDMITFHGNVSNMELIELLHEMDVFIMLSQELDNGDFEGFGIAILEANAAGLPSMGSMNSGIEDAISNGVSGYLVHHNNPEEVTSALENILEDFSGFSERAMQWAKKFRWEVIAEQYEALVNEDL